MRNSMQFIHRGFFNVTQFNAINDRVGHNKHNSKDEESSLTLATVQKSIKDGKTSLHIFICKIYLISKILMFNNLILSLSSRHALQ